MKGNSSRAFGFVFMKSMTLRLASVRSTERFKSDLLAFSVFAPFVLVLPFRFYSAPFFSSEFTLGPLISF